MSSAEQAAAVAQLRARGRQLAPPTDPNSGKPAAREPAAADAPAEGDAPAAAPARPSATRTSSSTRRPPSQFKTRVGPPVKALPPARNTTVHTPIRAPQPVADAVESGGGILLGLIGYAIGLNYVRNGWPGVTAWFRAKLLNQTGNPPAPAGGGGGIKRFQEQAAPSPPSTGGAIEV